MICKLVVTEGSRTIEVPCTIAQQVRSADKDEVMLDVRVSGVDMLMAKERRTGMLEDRGDGLDGFRALAREFPEWNIRVNP